MANVPYVEKDDPYWARQVEAYGWDKQPGGFWITDPCPHCRHNLSLYVPILIGVTEVKVEEAVAVACDCSEPHLNPDGKAPPRKGCGRYGTVRLRDNYKNSSA